MKRVRYLTCNLRSDERGLSVVLVLVVLAMGAVVGGVAATGGFSRLIGASIPTDDARGLDWLLSRDIFSKLGPMPSGSTPGPAGTAASGAASSSSTTTAPGAPPEAPPPPGGGGGGGQPGGVVYLQASAPGAIDWAILAFIVILVFGVVAAKVHMRGPVFGLVVLVVVIAVVVAAIATAAQGIDFDGDGDVDDVRTVAEAGFSGLLIFDGAVTYTDGSSEDAHATWPLVSVAQRGGKEVASMVFQVLLDQRCDGCEARLTGGFIAFAASRPKGHAEGEFLKEGPRLEIPSLPARANQSLELWRVAFDGVRLKDAIADSDTIGTYFLNLVGQIRLSISNGTGTSAPLVVDFAWPNMELHIENATSPGAPSRGCYFTTCVFPISIVGGTSVRWWYLATQGAPQPTSRAVLEDFGVI